MRNKTIGQGVNVMARPVWFSLPLGVSLVSSEPASSQTALQLFHEMQLALGGTPKDFGDTRF
jgi:hypothetical protein